MSDELSQAQIDQLLENTSADQLLEMPNKIEILNLANLAIDDPALITDAEIGKLARAIIFYLSNLALD